MSKKMQGIIYIEDIEEIKNMNKPVVIMVQGDFCGYCTQAKPAFMEFARNTPSIVAVTIQSDGDDKEKAVAGFFQSNGVPAYFGMNKNKNLVKHEGGRDVASLQNFAKSLQ
jgi:thiol-disulfide isomerase/thioredoxin